MRTSRFLFLGLRGPIQARLDDDDEPVRPAAPAPRAAAPAPRPAPSRAAAGEIPEPDEEGDEPLRSLAADTRPSVPRASDTPTFQGPGPQQPSQGQPAARAPRTQSVEREPREDRRWHAQEKGVDTGPLHFYDVFKPGIISGRFNADTLVWRLGMDDWAPLGRINSLARILTEAQASAASNGPPPVARQSPNQGPPPVKPTLQWWLDPIIPGDPFRGPFSFSEVQGMWANGELSSSTMVHRSDRPADYWSAISNDEQLVHKMPPLSSTPSRDWNVWIGGVSTPFCFRELEDAVRARRVLADTYVSHPQHAPKWAALESVSALRALREIIADLGPAPTSIPPEHARWVPPAATGGAASASVPSAQQGAPAPQAPAQQPAPVVTPQYLRFCTSCSCRAPLAPYPGNRYCQVETCRAKQY